MLCYYLHPAWFSSFPIYPIGTAFPADHLSKFHSVQEKMLSAPKSSGPTLYFPVWEITLSLFIQEVQVHPAVFLGISCISLHLNLQLILRLNNLRHITNTTQDIFSPHTLLCLSCSLMKRYQQLKTSFQFHDVSAGTNEGITLLWLWDTYIYVLAHLADSNITFWTSTNIRLSFLFLSCYVYLTESVCCCCLEWWHSTFSSPRATSLLSRCREV